MKQGRIMPKLLSCEMISWATVVRLVTRLATQIRKDEYCPDIIIAIGRGGYVPARLLADYLYRMNLTSIKIEHYFSGSHKRPVTTIIYPLTIDVTDQRVLLVDDVNDSGETFEVALEHMRKRSSPTDIRTAVLHNKTSSSYTPDYYAMKIIKWRWLTYPWAQVEDITAFIDEMDPRPESNDEISRLLELSYGIHASDKLLNYILEK